ncbi:MAG: hypothetical protein HY927_05255 [Elusimicrobia bacterium]|nr:hypothetical protein [Elusimicrobiota bacterium]
MSPSGHPDPAPSWTASRPVLAACAAALVLAGFLCYGGPTILDLGFYHDDWYSLTHIHFAPRTLSLRMEALAQTDVSQRFRPFDVFLWPALYGLFGLDPLPWQAFLLAVNVGIGLAAALLLLRYRVPAGLALLGGLLALSYPSKDATLFWPLDVINPLSLLFYLVGHLAFLGYVETGRPWRFAWCAAALLLSLTTYDQTVFLPLCWLATPDLFERGLPPRARKALAWAAAIVLGFLAYKLIVVPRLYGIPFRKAILLSPWHFLKVYLAGLNADFGPRLIASTLGTLWSALRDTPVTAVLGLALPWACLTPVLGGPGRGAGSSERTAGSPSEALVFLGAGLFLAGYLPIALSDYVPTPLNHQNRINLAPVLGLVLAAVGCAAVAAPARRAAAMVLAGLAGVFIAASAGSAGVWAESFRRQCAVQALVERNLDRWPRDKVLLLRLGERYVRGKAPVFDACWDITGAVRLWTGDKLRRAAVASPRMRFEPGEVVDPGCPSFPYEEAMLLDAESGSLEEADRERLRRLPNHPPPPWGGE